MCYMNSRERVGVRELRQNLSVYLRRILEGHSFEVTDRGVPVALLVPLPTQDSPLARLVAAGRATPPKRDLTQLGHPDTEARAGSPSRSTATLLDDRERSRQPGGKPRER